MGSFGAGGLSGGRVAIVCGSGRRLAVGAAGGLGFIPAVLGAVGCVSSAGVEARVSSIGRWRPVPLVLAVRVLKSLNDRTLWLVGLFGVGAVGGLVGRFGEGRHPPRGGVLGRAVAAGRAVRGFVWRRGRGRPSRRGGAGDVRRNRCSGSDIGPGWVRLAGRRSGGRGRRRRATSGGGGACRSGQGQSVR